VWNLFAIGEQIMRAAGCKNLAEKPKGVFRHAQQGYPSRDTPVFWPLMQKPHPEYKKPEKALPFPV